MQYVFFGIGFAGASCERNAARASHLCIAVTDSDVLSLHVPDQHLSPADVGTRSDPAADAYSSIDARAVTWLRARLPYGALPVAVCWTRKARNLADVHVRLPKLTLQLGDQLIQVDEVCRHLEGRVRYLDAMPDAAQWKEMAMSIARGERYLNGTLHTVPLQAFEEAVTCLLAWKWLRAVGGTVLADAARLMTHAEDCSVPFAR